MAEEAETEEEASGGGKGKLILIVGLVVLLLGGGGAAFMLMGGGEEEAVAEDGAEASEEAEQETPAEALYVPLDPAFVVNFHDENNRRKLMKVELNAVTRDPGVQEAITKHMPMIRNSLVLLFSRQVYEELLSHEGKEALRAKALEEVKLVLDREYGSSEVEDVLFTSFVMQ